MVFNIWNRNFIQFRRYWLISFFWIVFEPLVTLGAIGFGLGSFVSTINGTSYADFFFPALLCMSSMFISYFVSTYDNFSKLTHQGLFAVQILTPISPKEIVYGEVLWGASKGLFSAFGVSLVAASFGMVTSWKIILVFVFVFLSSLVFSAFGMLITTFVKNYDQIIYPSSGLIIPISLFSGTYFPIDQLPYALKYLAYLSPLAHSVRASRSILSSNFDLLSVSEFNFDWWLIVNFLYLCLCTFLLTKASISRLQKRLLD